MAETNLRRRKRAVVELSIVIGMLLCVWIFIQFPNTRPNIQKIVGLLLIFSFIYLYFNNSALASIIICSRRKYMLQNEGLNSLLYEDKHDEQEKLKEDQSTSDEKSYEALKEDDESIDDNDSISITIQTTK